MFRKLLFLLLITNYSLLIATAQWVSVSNGIENRYVYSLAYIGNNIFAGTNNYGVYTSTNNGINWTQTSLNNHYVYALALNGNNIFAGAFQYGVYKSTNNGASWTQTSLNNRNVFSLAVNGNNVFAGTRDSGVSLSTNNGLSWTQTFLNNRTVPSLAILGNNIFAGTYDYGVYLSTNNGTSWTQTTLYNQSTVSLAVNGNNIFAGSDYSAGVYLSTNNGTSWTRTSLDNRTVPSLAVNGSNNVFAGTVNNGVYVSNDNGISWTQRNEGFPNLTVNALCILNNYIFAGTVTNISGDGVYRRPLSELIGIKPISNEVPSSFSLSQNYPNPFNPTTKIQFALPKSSFAKLIIYDILGREVQTIVNEQLNAGTYEATWDAINYPSGVYYVKLTAGDFADSRKMILLK